MGRGKSLGTGDIRVSIPTIDGSKPSSGTIAPTQRSLRPIPGNIAPAVDSVDRDRNLPASTAAVLFIDPVSS